MDHRQTREYLNRKKHLRDMWIMAGLLMLALPSGGQMMVALFCTFLSFAYLDERPYGENREPDPGVSPHSPGVKTGDPQSVRKNHPAP